MDVAHLQDRALLVNRLRPRLAGAKRALVFGSVARGEANEWSDLDIVVIAETDKAFFERFRDFGGLYEGSGLGSICSSTRRLSSNGWWLRETPSSCEFSKKEWTSCEGGPNRSRTLAAAS